MSASAVEERQALISQVAAKLGIARNRLLAGSTESLAKALAPGDASAIVNKHGDPLFKGNDQPASFGDLGKVIAIAVQPYLEAKLDADGVEAIVETMIADALKNFNVHGTILTIRNAETLELKPIGRVHRTMPLLLKWLKLGSWPYMVGPAGSFKTSAAYAAAQALDVEFYCESMSEGTTPFDLKGFKDANGVYQRTALREAWEFGGVYLCDEGDAGNANVMATFNAMLSQEFALFPDGKMVKRHPRFYFILAANTLGYGADAKFVGRNQLDGATLDRFITIEWTYDEEFEIHVANSAAGSDQTDWVKYVQAVRAAALRAGVLENVVFATPRASIAGAKALAAGELTREEIEHGTLWAKLSPDDVSKVRANIR